VVLALLEGVKVEQAEGDGEPVKGMLLVWYAETSAEDEGLPVPEGERGDVGEGSGVVVGAREADKETDTAGVPLSEREPGRDSDGLWDDCREEENGGEPEEVKVARLLCEASRDMEGERDSARKVLVVGDNASDALAGGEPDRPKDTGAE
jgi:hypothetical protein